MSDVPLHLCCISQSRGHLRGSCTAAALSCLQNGLREDAEFVDLGGRREEGEEHLSWQTLNGGSTFVSFQPVVSALAEWWRHKQELL